MGLFIIDVSNPENPQVAGNYPGLEVRDVYVSGKYAYVAGKEDSDTGSGLYIIDVNDPETPSLKSSYTEFVGEAEGVYVCGKYAYITDIFSGLHIIDVSDRSSPALAGRCSVGDCRDVYVSGKYAYVASFGPVSGGLGIIEVSGIDTPTVLAGNVETGNITVTENADIGNDGYVHGGLSVGKDLLVGGEVSLSNTLFVQDNGGVPGERQVDIGTADHIADLFVTGRAFISGYLYRAGNTVGDSGNDGSGTGLDADKLDGQHRAYFATSTHNHN